MNVTRGGSMRQFIPELGLSPPMEHRKLEGKDARHKVTVEAGSVLAGVTGSGEIEANSAHKQAMGTIGRGLRVVATSPDGVVEGLEDASFPLYLGVQWHPERIHTERPHGGLFELLVKKSGEWRGGK